MNNEHQYKNKLSQIINNYIMKENWVKARNLLEKEIKIRPNEHWLITQLSEVYYEMENYDKALELSTRAMQLAPNCPLVLNDHALHLFMHEKDQEAIAIWKKLLKQVVTGGVKGDCDEEIKSSMLNDIRMRIGLSYIEIGQKEKALFFLKEHLENRKRGVFSNFSKREVLKKIKDVQESIEDDCSNIDNEW